MLNSKKTDLGKNTYQYTVEIPKEEIAKNYDEAFDLLKADLSVEGFRKGNVPKNIAEKHIEKDKVYKKVLDVLLPNLYSQLVKQEAIKPIVSPHIELVSAKEGENWVINIKIAEKPNIDLKTYKEKIKVLKTELKKDDIWVPGKEAKPEPDKDEKKKTEFLNKILEILIKEVEVSISDLILEQELNRRLTQLVDDVRNIGLSMDAYLKSKQETMDSVKEKYKREIAEMYKLEFILEEIAEIEKIVVEKKDFDILLANIEDEKAKKQAQENAYYYASVLKRQKTLDYLMSL